MLNADKCKLIIFSNKNETASLCLNNKTIENSKSEKLLGITLDHKLTFNEHISNICNKATQKLHALARVSSYMNTEKLRSIMKAFICSQFGYCPLTWMSHSRTLNKRINKIQERALRLVYNDKVSTFKQLLEKDKSVTVHDRNLQSLAIELYKLENNLSPNIMKQVFINRNISYSLRNIRAYQVSNVKTGRFGT